MTEAFPAHKTTARGSGDSVIQGSPYYHSTKYIMLRKQIYTLVFVHEFKGMSASKANCAYKKSKFNTMWYVCTLNKNTADALSQKDVVPLLKLIPLFSQI
jgi:hypothetical protein